VIESDILAREMQQGELIQAFNPHWIDLDDARQNKPFG
jgi:hypothetical protein